MRRWIWLAAFIFACDANDPAAADSGAIDGGMLQDAAFDSGAIDTGPADSGVTSDVGLADATPADEGVELDADFPDAGPSGPTVDRTSPQLFHVSFSADDADPAATLALGTELAAIDTRVTPRGELVVYLHGAGAPTNCGATAHADFLADLGYHVVMPCYVSDYGVGNCGTDIGGCRLEAFEGIDHSSVIDITPANAIETRVVMMLERLATENPQGDWAWFIDGNRPRWSAIIISGISHGASSAGLIGKYRNVARVVMLSGPLDSNQAWLALPTITPIDRFWGFTHTADDQHDGHLAAFETMGLPGVPVSIDNVAAPYNGSHRLQTSAATGDGHSSTQAGGASPRAPDNSFLFAPVWRAMYTN